MTQPTQDEGLSGKHARCVIGIVMMTLGILAYIVPAIMALMNGQTLVPKDATWVTAVIALGFPALLVVAGYNLYSHDAFVDVVSTVKGMLPGKSA